MNGKLKLVAGALAVGAVGTGVAVAASSPAVTTGSTSLITETSAVLHGIVNPNGASTDYQFQWGLTTAYDVTGAAKRAGHGTVPVPAQAAATGLLPGTTYHYRLLAHSRFGLTVGSDHSFTTAGHPEPGVTTGAPSQIAPTSSTVTGVIAPNGEQTTYYFQFGLTPTYTYQTLANSVPAGTAPVVVSAQLEGIAPLTVFHYRIVALHGTTFVADGQDATFLTEPAIRPRPRIRARTTPRQARRRPFAFTTSGSVAGPSDIPAATGCAQTAIVRFTFGRRLLAATTMAVQPNCTFSGTTTIPHLPGRGKRHRVETVRVVVTAQGNGYLAPAQSRNQTVKLGG
jgi:hypothetical protein